MPYQLIDTVTPDVGAKAGADKINNNAVQAQYQGGYFTVGGTANSITLTSATGAPSGYATGQEFCFRANATNTGVTTVNVDGLGIKTIKTISGADLPSGYLSTSADTCLRYDGVNMVANVSTGTLADQVPTNADLSASIAGTATFSSDVYTFSPSGAGFHPLLAGMYLSFRLPSGSANTTATPDIDYNGSTYVIKWIDGSALESDDLDQAYNKQPILFYFDGTDMLIASDISGSNGDGDWCKTAQGYAFMSNFYTATARTLPEEIIWSYPKTLISVTAPVISNATSTGSTSLAAGIQGGVSYFDTTNSTCNIDDLSGSYTTQLISVSVKTSGRWY